MILTKNSECLCASHDTKTSFPEKFSVRFSHNFLRNQETSNVCFIRYRKSHVDIWNRFGTMAKIPGWGGGGGRMVFTPRRGAGDCESTSDITFRAELEMDRYLL